MLYYIRSDTWNICIFYVDEKKSILKKFWLLSGYLFKSFNYLMSKCKSTKSSKIKFCDYGHLVHLILCMWFWMEMQYAQCNAKHVLKSIN